MTPIREDAEALGLACLAGLLQIAIQLSDVGAVGLDGAGLPDTALDLDHQVLGLDIDAVAL